jgi:arylformamidase
MPDPAPLRTPAGLGAGAPEVAGTPVPRNARGREGAMRMAYIVTAEWRAKPGTEGRLAEIFEELTERSRGEPGTLFYETHRSPGDPQLFYLYQQYVDEPAYQAHVGSEHYARLVEGEAIPEILEAREREAFDARTRLVDLTPTAPHGHWPSEQPPPNRRAGRHAGSALRAVVEGEPIDAVPLDRVIGTAVVLDLTPVAERATIDVAALERGEAKLRDAGEQILPGDIFLLRTDWTERAIGSPQWFRHSPALTPDAALWLAARRPKCIGCDFFEADAPVQHQILEAGIPLADGLVNLSALPERCEFFAPFYEFGDIEATPARAFAWAWDAP